ncbi:hypothetical protein ACS0TY_000234 [Phlomoides rotata]
MDPRGKGVAYNTYDRHYPQRNQFLIKWITNITKLIQVEPWMKKSIVKMKSIINQHHKNAPGVAIVEEING